MLKITQLAKNLSLSKVEYAEFGSTDSGDCENETVEISPRTSKNLNGATGYLTPEVRLTFTQLRKAFTKVWILQPFD